VGWVVYEETQGKLIKYHKKIGQAKAMVTRHNNKKRRGPFGWQWLSQDWLAWCDYQDYEGVLLGLRGDELKLWQFVNSKKKSAG
jgi:hypothetical protein